jgi:rhomboid protease GluP
MRPQPVIPVRRVEIPHSQPFFSYILLAINILVFLLDYFVFQGMFTGLGAKNNDAIIAGEYWRLITPMFLHGGFLHLAFNSYFLYQVGPQVEKAFGHFRFMAIYFLSGLGASIASFAFTPGSSVGASGALFGLIGALVPLLYRNRDVLAHTRSRISSIVQVILINLLIGFTARGLIDNWGHIGGLVAGLSLAWLTTPRYAVRLAPDGTPERVEDETPPSATWFWYAFVALGMVATVQGLIWLKQGLLF